MNMAHKPMTKTELLKEQSDISKNYPEILCIVDVCLCEYTSHGHCGVVENGEILNDETLPLLCKMAVSLVEAGADMVAPSDMMDGRVSAIRDALDNAGYKNTPIMAYSANLHQHITGHSEMLLNLLLALAIEEVIKWILQTLKKH